MKWNDFQTNVCKTFSSLRKEEHLFDVTLVSDDEKHISAHKLVLSASSELFKNIIKKTPHTNPMIFLSGFKANDLLLVMDYIYQGEVQILQSDLDGFLDVAQRLKIEGLIGGDNASADESNNFGNDFKEDLEPSNTEEQYLAEIGLTDHIKETGRGVTIKKKTQRAERSVAIAGNNVANLDQSCTEYFGSSVFANSWDQIVLFGLWSLEIFH